MISKFYCIIGNYQCHAHAGYDVANCFRSAANWISLIARITKIVLPGVSYKQLSSQMAKLCVLCDCAKLLDNDLNYDKKSPQIVGLRPPMCWKSAHSGLSDVSLYWDRLPSFCSFVRHEISSSNISKTFRPRITNFTQTSIPTLLRVIPDMTSLITSDRKL